MSRPSAPGVSVDISGAAKLAARRIRRLGKAVPIDFSTEADNELVAWYRGRSDRLVRALQLRQEREGPYFHQFVVFELKDGGGFFRIDRRLRPDEDTPLNSLKDEGIPAYDTIEPVVAWDDPLFPASDCLISIEFKVDVYLALILKVCRAIQEHPLAKVYTLQRYNCYFFAQTIMLWATCGAADWAGAGNSPPHWMPTPNSNKGFLKLNKPSHKHTDYSKLAHTSTPITTQFTYKGYTLTLTFAQKTHLPDIQRNEIHQLKIVAPSWEMNDVKSLCNKIDASVQHLLETYWKEERIYQLLYKYLMNTSFLQTSEDIPSYYRSRPRFNEIIIEVRSAQEAGLDSGPTDALIFQKTPPHPIHHPSDLVLAGETRLLWDNPMPRKLESFGIYFSNQDQWEELIDKYNSLDDYHERIENAYLDLFEQSMVIKIVYGTAVQQNTPQETTPDSNLEDIPQYRRPRRTIFRWRKAKQEQEQEQEQRMRPASIIEMQKYLVHLIDIHSIRVEEYKWATKAIATDVAGDIKRAMDEVWGNLIE
ncbi:unnamed protein product [Rhizoctonia solani]|uniref:Uncharacterized protein n=1 Tax=Rhizoctonia solani TaxID=456999 RepID=A0A8H3BBA3_9AGAM|nr:unnamed protein product [Rhizoctonia solani]